MAPPGPDIHDVSSKDLQKGHFKGAGSETFRVALSDGPYNDVVKHGMEHQGVEVCGVLVGRILQDEGGPFLEIEATIRGEHAASQGAQVTFTHETWNHIHNEMDKRFPERKIVGWYHTHPGFGIFLSEFDLFIHQSFFNAPFQVAFVFDPRSGDEGFFCWKEGKTSRLAHFWVGRQMHCCRPAFEEVRRPPESASDPRAGHGQGEAARAANDPGAAPASPADADRLSPPPLSSLLTPLLLILCGLMVGFLIGTIQGRRESDAVIGLALQREVREMVRMEVLHTGLSKEMESLERIVADAAGVVDSLEKAGGTAAGTVPAEPVRKALAQVRERMATMRERYETLDRLVTDAMKGGAASLQDLEQEIRTLRGQMLDMRRLVVSEMLISARAMLDQAERSGESGAEMLRARARESYDRALVLTPEDREMIARLFPEFSTPKEPAKGSSGGSGNDPEKK